MNHIKQPQMEARLIRILALVALFWTGCSDERSFVIDGQFSQAGGIRTVSLYEGNRKLDSAFLNEKGAFRFHRTASHPRLLTLEAGNRRYHLILQNGDRITFQADLTQGSDVYEVSGSPLSEKIKEFASVMAEKEKFEVELESEFAGEAAGLEGEALTQLQERYLQRYRDHHADYVTKAVRFAEIHDDLAGFFAMSTLEMDLAENELIDYADRIAGRWEDNARVREFLEEMSQRKRLAIGQPAPDFESLTLDNKRVRLSDFRGKYTLVDFWASWCVPCRRENPNIVRQYHAYKDKGFTVLGVSLDGNPGSWMRAIQEDHLEWTQVSDLREWGSEVVGLYRIRAIPTSYLVDPEGIIIAKNLRGRELEAFLKKTLD